MFFRYSASFYQSINNDFVMLTATATTGAIDFPVKAVETTAEAGLQVHVSTGQLFSSLSLV